MPLTPLGEPKKAYWRCNAGTPRPQASYLLPHFWTDGDHVTGPLLSYSTARLIPGFVFFLFFFSKFLIPDSGFQNRTNLVTLVSYRSL